MPDLREMKFHEARRFSLGMVFIDICSSGRYLTEHSPEETLFMLNLFIPEVMHLVEDNDGYFEKNTGDGILAYFGVGETHEEATDRVLGFIADVKFALANCLNPELEHYGLDPISISAGAAYAEDVYISRIGVYNASRRVAISTATNAAFVLEEKADENQFLVDNGISSHASDDGLGRFLEFKGVLNDYLRGSEQSGYRSTRYYDFYGGWDSTIEDNL